MLLQGYGADVLWPAHVLPLLGAIRAGRGGRGGRGSGGDGDGDGGGGSCGLR